jgi:alpha-1,2-mannosyltransferase
MNRCAVRSSALDPSFGSGRVLGVAAIVGILGLCLAVLASRRGDKAMGFSLCAVTGLLVSPVSWTHHWTLAVPALLLLGLRVYRNRSKVGIIAVGATLLAGYSYLPKLMSKPASHRGRRLPQRGRSPPASYVLIGLVALAIARAYETRRAAAALPTRRAAFRRGFAAPTIAPGLKGTR